MSDKTTDQINDNDEQEFSLNNVDLSDDKTAIDDNNEPADALYVPDKENEAFDSAFEDDKQAPSVPELFESTAQDLTADTINNQADAYQADAYQTAPSAEPNNMPVSPKLTETDLTEADGSASPEPSSNNTMFIFAGIAVVLVVLVAWFNLKTSNEPSHHGDMNVNMDVVDAQQPSGNDQQAVEKQITMLQERISSMQTRLISKDREIAELTHQVSELSRSQTTHNKKVVLKKKAPAIQKPSATTQAIVTPIRQQTTGSWAIIIASVNSRIAAEKALARLKAKGIAADIRPTTVKGKDWFRVRVSGFASRAEAEVQKTYLAQQHGIKGVWIHKAK